MAYGSALFADVAVFLFAWAGEMRGVCKEMARCCAWVVGEGVAAKCADWLCWCLSITRAAPVTVSCLDVLFRLFTKKKKTCNHCLRSSSLLLRLHGGVVFCNAETTPFSFFVPPITVLPRPPCCRFHIIRFARFVCLFFNRFFFGEEQAGCRKTTRQH